MAYPDDKIVSVQYERAMKQDGRKSRACFCGRSESEKKLQTEPFQLYACSSNGNTMETPGSEGWVAMDRQNTE